MIKQWLKKKKQKKQKKQKEAFHRGYSYAATKLLKSRKSKGYFIIEELECHNDSAKMANSFDSFNLGIEKALADYMLILK